MKRIIAFLLAATLVLSLTACQKNTPSTGESESASASTEANDSPFQDVSETATALSNVNIRTSCSDHSDSIAILLAGDTIVRTGWSEDWSRVQYNGKECYIATEYLSESSLSSAQASDGSAESETEQAAATADASESESTAESTASSETTATEIPTTPIDTSNLAALDNTSIPFGYASDQRDEFNRPTGCISYQTAYGSLNADFLKGTTNTIYLTFDEGYENGYTPQILDVLKEKNVRAVFFITMPYAKSQPELVQRMIDEGHVVGNHSNTHPADGMPSLGLDAAREDVMSLHNYVKENFDYDMYLFRCPAGIFSQQFLALNQSLGYRSVFWSFAHRDWVTDDQPDQAETLQKVVSQLHPGAIYLLHAVSSTNTAILGDFIDQARAAGYTFGYYEK
ncbi:MAG: polysaccharide deacetylase family protein [Cuneatibacter sp.]|nr:polysaccharide deacetylase family protein [Cuneatibacter sp.]